jgi:hypothetical protein
MIEDMLKIGAELGHAAVLSCDLSKFELSEFEQFKNPTNKRPYYVAYLVCKFIMSGTDLDVEIHWNKRIVCSEKIRNIETDRGGIGLGF